MDVHRGDDLQVVDQHHRSVFCLRDMAGHFSADEIQPCLVVALLEPEVAGIGRVLCLGKL